MPRPDKKNEILISKVWGTVPSLKVTYVLDANDIEKIQNGSYEIDGMPDGIYGWGQIKESQEIENARLFSAKTIFAWPKLHASAHQLHIHRILKIANENVMAAGILVISNKILQRWNLKSGSYKDLCHLEQKEAPHQIGLPIKLFEKIDIRETSPTQDIRYRSLFFSEKPIHDSKQNNFERTIDKNEKIEKRDYCSCIIL